MDAACVLYAVCMLFPGALDLTALLVGAFEYFISVGATRPAASISFTGVGLAVAPGAVRAALRWRYGAEATHAWRAPRQHFLAGAMRQVVYNIILPLWDAGPFDLRGVRQWVPDQWWHLPRCRLVVLTGWCPGLLAGSAGHALGLSYTGWLACGQHGTVYVGQDPDEALELIRQWLPVVWEAWYFCMPRPELLQALPVVARPGAGVRCWAGAVGRERLYRAAVALLSGYIRCAVLRATHSALVRGLSIGPQDCNATVKYLYHIGPRLPMPRLCAVDATLGWIRRHAMWWGTEYSSRSLPLHLRPGNALGAWCLDYAALLEHGHALHRKL